MKKLTLKQQKFIACYKGNATKAALEAGYSAKTACAIGNENLTKPEIIEAIQQVTKTDISKKIATREELQEFWTSVYNDSSVSTSDRLRASELLGKSMATFVERSEVKHEGTVTVKHLDIAERLQSLAKCRI